MLKKKTMKKLKINDGDLVSSKYIHSDIKSIEYNIKTNFYNSSSCLTPKIEEINMIQTGIVEIIKTPLITCI